MAEERRREERKPEPREERRAKMYDHPSSAKRREEKKPERREHEREGERRDQRGDVEDRDEGGPAIGGADHGGPMTPVGAPTAAAWRPRGHAQARLGAGSRLSQNGYGRGLIHPALCARIASSPRRTKSPSNQAGNI